MSPKWKILIVEDNKANLDMLSRRLERRDFEVISGIDGNEAIEKARSENPDLILMDMSLPGIDGWEATRRIKEMEETKSIPIVALTAHAMSGDRARAIEAGCDDYDTKPVDMKRLLEKINNLLDSSSAG